MDTFLQKNDEKKGINKGFILAFLIAAVLIAGGIYLLTFLPTMDEQRAQMLEGFYLEGTPEFDQITKDLVISTDTDRTTQSPTGLGTIQMNIVGKIRNKGSKTINGLEIKVGVVDRFNEILREKKVVVIPGQHQSLEPAEIIPVTITLDGFAKDDDRANVRWKVTGIRTE
jgi:hypothetical protein